MRACRFDGCKRPHKARGMCNTHYQEWRRGNDGPLLLEIPREDRFWAKVNKNGPIPEHSPDLGQCWIWTGGTARGYGRFWAGQGKKALAHRYAYELIVGPIPDGLELDHLCRVVLCINPSHLEPVTHQVNQQRGFSPVRQQAEQTHCLRGHLFDEKNTRVRRGRRECRACRRGERERLRERTAA
jgi:hypothetical protein